MGKFSKICQKIKFKYEVHFWSSFGKMDQVLKFIKTFNLNKVNFWKSCKVNHRQIFEIFQKFNLSIVNFLSIF